MAEKQEVRIWDEKVLKVAEIATASDLEEFFNQRGFFLWRASELVGSLGRFEQRHGLNVAHVADETGEGYVFWFDGQYRNSQRGLSYLLVNVRETREEALAEAREMYEEAVRGEGGYREDPEWFAEVEA